MSSYHSRNSHAPEIKEEQTSHLIQNIVGADLLPHSSTIDLTSQPCAKKERSAEFPVERVGFPRRWSETVLEHDGDLLLDL